MQSQTAPCLLDRVLLYNFHDPYHALFQFPSFTRPCQHVFSTNPTRTFLPKELDPRPDAASNWTVALTCQLCRTHVDIKIDFSHTKIACSESNLPFHHFVYDVPEEAAEDEYPRQYTFKCTNFECAASLWIIMRPPELHPTEIDYLTSVESRIKAVRASSAATVKDRSPLEALHVLRSYVQGCLDNSGRTIWIHNTAFATCVGDGGSALMRRLGFTLLLDKEEKLVWKPPLVASHDTPPNFDLARCMLEDIRDELTALIQGRPEAEKRGANVPDLYPPPPGHSKTALSILFGITPYKTISLDQIPRIEPYLGLGALADFDDMLIAWCYDRVTNTFPNNTPFYFRCLKDIADDRQSEFLATKAMTLESQGLHTDIDIQNAWRVIGIDHSHQFVISDDNILSHFQSRYQDSGPDERQRMLQALGIVADFRNSPLLKDAANGTMDTYDQALAFLGAEHTTADEFILSLKTAKEQEDQWNQGRAARALEIIAKHRNSNLLLAAAQGDSHEDPKMEVAQAYAILGADPSADDDTLIFAFPGLITDYPGRRAEIIQAMLSIADDRRSNELKQQAEAALQGEKGNANQLTVEDPRGLENIGNTCYLNSFLQYLFTVKPLRELLETMDEHRQDTSPETLALKKVSDERVTETQVVRAQSFVSELKLLFEELKTTRYRSVRLHKSLAALTVAPTGDWTATREQEKRRRSTLVSSKPPRIKVNDNQVNGPTSLNNTDAVDLTESPLEERSISQAVNENSVKFTDPPTPSEAKTPEALTLPDATQPLTDDPMIMDDESPSKASESTLVGDEVAASASTQPDPPSEPNGPEPQGETTLAKPPPVPPRNGVNSADHLTGASKEKIEEWAQQQDMREALANVFRQLRWAMKNEDEPKGQEQVDVISRLFYGKENIVTGNMSQQKTTESIPFHALYVIPDERYETIYSMLDGAYGVRDITDETSQQARTQYSTFTHLPPILHIDVAVTTWDKEAQHAVRRAPFKVAESFYMDRYLDDPVLVEKRKHMSTLNATLDNLKAKRARFSQNDLGMEMPSVLRSVGTYLTELSEQAADVDLEQDIIPDSLIQDINYLADNEQRELQIVDAQIDAVTNEMAALFPEEGELLYRLHAVCVHSGRAESGHYYIFINDGDVWFKYNDETVERVTDPSVALNPQAGSTGVPAMLVYVKASEATNIMQTVCREPSESMTQAVYQEGCKVA